LLCHRGDRPVDPVVMRPGVVVHEDAVEVGTDVEQQQLRRPLQDQVMAAALVRFGRWDEVPAFLTGSRAFAERAGLRALPVHLDRLEGRAALAAGDTSRAVGTLAAASTAFEGLGARWEKACTDLSLAEALIAADRRGEARERLHRASEVFEDLRSIREIQRSRELSAKLEA